MYIQFSIVMIDQSVRVKSYSFFFFLFTGIYRCIVYVCLMFVCYGTILVTVLSVKRVNVTQRKFTCGWGGTREREGGGTREREGGGEKK